MPFSHLQRASYICCKAFPFPYGLTAFAIWIYVSSKLRSFIAAFKISSIRISTNLTVPVISKGYINLIHSCPRPVRLQICRSPLLCSPAPPWSPTSTSSSASCTALLYMASFPPLVWIPLFSLYHGCPQKSGKTLVF